MTTPNGMLNGRFQIERCLGEGGFGRTFLAKDRHRQGAYCVVKQLHLRDSLALELFEREADALIAIDKHPNVPVLHSYFQEEGEWYLVEEYVEGSTLTEIVRTHGVFSEDQLLGFLKELLPLLSFIHRKQILHRDIKPDNLMLRRDRHYVLIDFGVSKIGETGGLSGGTRVSSAGYTPQEQLAGKATAASDVYALGATCLFLVTGQLPTDLYDEFHMTWRLDGLRNRISAGVLGVLQKMVEPRLSRRYQNADQVLRELFNGGSGTSTATVLGTVRLGPPQATVPAGARRGFSVVGVGAVSAIVVLSALTTALSLGRSSPVDQSAEAPRTVAAPSEGDTESDRPMRQIVVPPTPQPKPQPTVPVNVTPTPAVTTRPQEVVETEKRWKLEKVGEIPSSGGAVIMNELLPDSRVAFAIKNESETAIRIVNLKPWNTGSLRVVGAYDDVRLIGDRIVGLRNGEAVAAWQTANLGPVAHPSEVRATPEEQPCTSLIAANHTGAPSNVVCAETLSRDIVVSTGGEKLTVWNASRGRKLAEQTLSISGTPRLRILEDHVVVSGEREIYVFRIAPEQ